MRWLHICTNKMNNWFSCLDFNLPFCCFRANFTSEGVIQIISKDDIG